MLGQLRAVLQKPIKPFFEVCQISRLQEFQINGLHGKEGYQSNHRPYLQGDKLLPIYPPPLSQMQQVIVKAVLLIPEMGFLSAHLVQGISNVEEMLKKFTRHFFIS